MSRASDVPLELSRQSGLGQHRATQHLTARQRAAAYRWLAGLFAREATIETLRVYRSAKGKALLTELGEIAVLGPAVDGINARLADASDADLATISLDLAGAFAKLFLGVGGRRSAPPYQSFHVGAQNRLMQQSAAKMQDQLQRLDARVADSFPEPPDHISVQLEVMAALTTTADPAEQIDYLEHRLVDWVDDFRDRCAVADKTGFYAAAAHALVDFVHADVAALRG